MSKDPFFHAMWDYQKESKFTDFCLKVESQSTMVHKVVLACKSKFFAKLYRHSPTVSEYTIDGATFEVVQMIVGLLYLGPDGEVAKSTEEQSEEFCKLALRFSINEFAKGLLHDLEVGGITTQLAPWALVEAVRKDDDLLAMMLIEYMERNGGKRQLLNAPAFFETA
ncbi:BTB/POZ and MATH domain-containing protein 6 [Aphelenchoides besseyi]|nr:BTB/POZ and MATH domain-containing protein 6 [Aphelenchoides besseyi]